jgi:VWFA-related protein
VLTFSFFLFTLAQTLAQDLPHFQTANTLVRVEARVVDQNNKHIAGLKTADFAIFDNGIEQPVLQVDSDALPLDLVLLLDVSPSMLSQLKTAAAAASTAMAGLRPDDRVAIHTFCRKHKEFLPFTQDKEKAVRALADLAKPGSICSGTVLNSAVYKSALTLQKQIQPGRRRAVLLFTDNHAFRGTPDAVVQNALAEADATLNAVIYSSRSHLGRPSRLKADARPLVEQSGGDWLVARDASLAFSLILERIRYRYVLHFSAPPSEPGQLHQVRVQWSEGAKAAYPASQVIARKSYTSKP